MTGYVYGSLFFTPIDVPFLAAMTWATLAIAVMARQVLPSWPSTLAAGGLTGLAIATRTGGIITHAYLLGAMLLCATEFFAVNGRMTARYLVQIAMRCAAVVAIGWVSAIALWPWLQIGNPLQQFKTALVHFANMPMAFEFSHWGERVWTNALPRSYIPKELLARLPEAFLVLLAVALVCAVGFAVTLVRETHWRPDRKAAVRAALLALARERGIFLVCLAVILPLAFLIVQRATIYDGVRHVLFVIPMLRSSPGSGWRQSCHSCVAHRWLQPSLVEPMPAASCSTWPGCTRSNTSRSTRSRAALGGPTTNSNRIIGRRLLPRACVGSSAGSTTTHPFERPKRYLAS
jgi:hypothetical protein